jgi:GGDEF domain-containing protein
MRPATRSCATPRAHCGRSAQRRHPCAHQSQRVGVLLEDCGPKEALHVDGALRDRVSGFEFAWNAQRFTLGASAGDVAFHDGACDPGELLASADEACDAG